MYTPFLLTSSVLPEHLTPGIQCPRGSKPERRGCVYPAAYNTSATMLFSDCYNTTNCYKEGLQILTRNSSHKKQSITPGVLGEQTITDGDLFSGTHTGIPSSTRIPSRSLSPRAGSSVSPTSFSGKMESWPPNWSLSTLLWKPRQEGWFLGELQDCTPGALWLKHTFLDCP